MKQVVLEAWWHGCVASHLAEKDYIKLDETNSVLDFLVVSALDMLLVELVGASDEGVYMLFRRAITNDAFCHLI